MTTSTPQSPKRNPADRCRVVVIADGEVIRNINASTLTEILKAGDVASIIFSTVNDNTLTEVEFQKLVEPLVSAAQNLNIAAIVADQTRIAGRVKADGLQLGQDKIALKEAIEKFTPAMMVGSAGIKTRHTALEIGELQPDYVMFGKPGSDIRPEPHPKNLDMGSWWATMVEIPCIVMAGTSLDSVIDVAKTGADFVGLGAAIFTPDTPDTQTIDGAKAALRLSEINQMLDEHAPSFETLDS